MKRGSGSFALGSLVRDTVTPFEGTVVARAEYLFQSDEYLVASKVLLDGKPNELWLDAARLVHLADNSTTGFGK
jgi:hypothetical protein